MILKGSGNLYGGYTLAENTNAEFEAFTTGCTAAPAENEYASGEPKPNS